MTEGSSRSNRKDGEDGKFLEKGVVALVIIFASTLAGPLWAALTINSPSSTQDLQATLLGFLIGVILVSTADLARMK